MSSTFLVAIVVHVLLATATGYVYDYVMPYQPPFPFMEMPSIENSRIVGGKKTTIDKFPYQLSLQIPYMPHLSTHHFCGASIISREWAITAAHCLYGIKVEDVLVRAGTSFYSEGGVIHTFSKIVIHENYKEQDTEHDIALGKVENPFTFSNVIQPIPIETDEIASGTIASVTGWGETMKFMGQKTQLREVSVPIINEAECRLAYGDEIYEGNIYEGNICAGYKEGGKDACQGDSGGPLAANGKLVGIISWGHGCALPGRPGVYTKVSAYRDWITKITESTV